MFLLIRSFMSLSTVTKGLFLASAVALAPFAHAAATDAKIESNVIAIPAAPKASDVIATVGPYSLPGANSRKMWK
jgi:hypothetical protein